MFLFLDWLVPGRVEIKSSMFLTLSALRSKILRKCRFWEDWSQWNEEGGRDLGNGRDVRNGTFVAMCLFHMAANIESADVFCLPFFVVRCISRFDCFNQCGPLAPNPGRLQRGLIVSRLYHFYPLLSVVFGNFFQVNLCTSLKRSITNYPWPPPCRWWWMGRWCWGRCGSWKV